MTAFVVSAREGSSRQVRFTWYATPTKARGCFLKRLDLTRERRTHALVDAFWVSERDGALERLHREARRRVLLLGDLEAALDEHLLLARVVEAELDLRLDLVDAGDLCARGDARQLVLGWAQAAARREEPDSARAPLETRSRSGFGTGGRAA